MPLESSALEVTLIYNPNSGGVAGVTSDELLKALYDEGFRAVHPYTECEEDLDAALAQPGDLVVTVGGDGTTRAVATRLLGRDVPLAVIPAGTANNVARTLGVAGKPAELVRGLRRSRRCKYDVGKVTGPWGESYFLEALGVGLFADMLADYHPEQGKSVLRAVGSVRDILIDYKARHWRVALDGQDVSGDYVALEVLNTKATGPRLVLAPEADPTDGLLDVVFVLVPENVTLLDYATRLLQDKFEELPNVRRVLAKELKLTWQGEPLHLDAEVRGQEGAQPAAEITVSVLPQALELLLPEAVAEK
ncbi:diacylglycerol kinase family lipid kinase [soil metagenome]